jgi:hypothetical protein
MLDLWEGGTVKLPNLDYLQGYKLTELNEIRWDAKDSNQNACWLSRAPLALFHFFLGAQITTRAAAQVEFPSGPV